MEVTGPAPTGVGPFRDTDLHLEPGDDRFGHKRRSRAFSWEARQAVEHRQTAWWRMLPGIAWFRWQVPLDEDVLEEDRHRLGAWFAARGFFEPRVEVSSGPVVKLGFLRFPTAFARRHVYVRFNVDLGPRSNLLGMRLSLPDGLDPALEARVRRLAHLEVGPYDGAARFKMERSISLALQDEGHGLVAVRGVLEAAEVPDVRLRVDVDPGPVVRFGSVEVSGLERVRPSAVARAVASAAPRETTWRGTRLARMGASLASLEALEIVEVSAGALDDEGRAAVHVEVEEAPRRLVEIAYGGSVRPGFLLAGAGVAWRVRQLAGGLGVVYGQTRVGYAHPPAWPTTWQGDHGPSGDHVIALDLPLAPRHGLSFIAENRGELAVAKGHHELSGGVSAGLRWRPVKHLRFDVEMDVDAWHHFPFPGQEERFNAQFVPRVEGGTAVLERSYVLQHLQLTAVWDNLQGEANPYRGVMTSLVVSPLWFLRGEGWFRGRAEVDAYFPIARRDLVLRLRAAGGLLERWRDGDHPGLLGSRFFLGGSYDVRGWGERSLSPPGFLGDSGSIQPGGNVMAFATVELRGRLYRNYWLSGFVDVGRVWFTLDDVPDPRDDLLRGKLSLGDLQPSAGAGLRLPFSFGVIRIDVAMRLRSDSGLPPYPPTPVLHFGFRGWE